MRSRSREPIVAILLILGVAAILMPRVNRAWDMKNLAGCAANLKALGTACEMYSTDSSGRFPTRLPQLFRKRCIGYLPTCPATGTDTYSATFVGASNPDAYTITCGGVHHAWVGVPDDFPRYTSTRGLTVGVDGLYAQTKDEMARCDRELAASLESANKHLDDVREVLDCDCSGKARNQVPKNLRRRGFDVVRQGTDWLVAVGPDPLPRMPDIGLQGKIRYIISFDRGACRGGPTFFYLPDGLGP